MKNIVICCDGTGNDISENISNVLKLYRVLRKSGKGSRDQVAFYDPGVGTLARPDPFTRFKQNTRMVLGLALGYGLDDNVLRAYEFLVDEYQDGDDIFLFGFSRGAYAVRVLAGFIHAVGLLWPAQRHLAGAALTAYKQSSAARAEPNGGTMDDVPLSQTRRDTAAQFARIVGSRAPTIAFVGVWDTVASVIVPRPDRYYTFDLQRLLHTENNCSVKVFRQAIAIDERRRMFRLQPWDLDQRFRPNRFGKTNETAQNVQQVWFAGVHSDVGGGYPEAESGLAKFPLLWMIDEAVKHGVVVNKKTVNQLAWGVNRKGSPYTYVEPDVDADPHDSMNAKWRLLEYFPKNDKYKEWSARRSLLGRYVPRAEPRPIPRDAFVHESVMLRMQNSKRGYRPVNLLWDPAPDRVVPMPQKPQQQDLVHA
jgi:uncharacterized protein (DUF2235 family)